eukprot:CFRG6997T1
MPNTSTGFMTDGFGLYKDLTDCREKIVASAETPYITLNLDSIYTECNYDHLFVYDGESIHSPLIATFSGIPPLRNITVTSSAALIRFTSDVSTVKNGYNVTYTFNTCPNNCTSADRGVCGVGGLCVCVSGYTGLDCGVRVCPGVGDTGICSGAGSCVDGRCVCDAGFSGLDCSQDTSKSRWMSVISPNEMGSTLYNYTDPSIRSGHVSAIIDFPVTSTMWIFGGLSGGFLDTDLISFYDESTIQWTSVVPVNVGPSARHAHSMVGTPENRLWVFGGTSGNSDSLKDLWEFNPNTSTWTRLMDAPFGLSRHTAQLRESTGSMIALLGYTDVFTFTYEILEYIPETNTWTQHSNIKGPRVIGSSVVSTYYAQNDAVIVSGGLQPRSSTRTSSSHSTFMLSLVDMVWTERQSQPIATYNAGGVQVGPVLYIYGGNGYIGGDGQEKAALCYLEFFMLYDIINNQWHKVQIPLANSLETPGRRYGHVMQYLTTSSNILLHGGYNGMLEGGTYAFDPGLCTNLNDEDECFASGCYWCRGSSSCLRPVDAVGDNCLSTVTLDSTGDVRSNETCFFAVDCATCYGIEGCKWDNLICSKITDTDNSSYSVENCPLPCPLRTNNCTECTGNDRLCVWCDSTSACIALNEYTDVYKYGQCSSYSYNTETGGCPDTRCEAQESYKTCYNTAGCGWCDSPSLTGLGVCMDGDIAGPINGSCPLGSVYYFSPPSPACQCSGHSTCDGGGVCVECDGNTEGLQCESCAVGYYGNALNNGTCVECQREFNGVTCFACDPITGGCTNCNGNVTGDACDTCKSGYFGDALSGSCTECLCNNQTNVCNATTGVCIDCPPGVEGDHCETCSDQYTGDPTAEDGHCYFSLAANTRYEVTLREDYSRYFYVSPVRSNSELNITFLNSAPAAAPELYLPSLTIIWYTSDDPEIIVENFTERYYTNVFSPATYPLDSGFFELQVSTIGEIPGGVLTFQVFFTQYSPPPNLVKFFITFFACFFVLLVLGLSVWKVRLIQLRRRAVRARQVELETMAARPFATATVMSLDDNYSLTGREGGGPTKMPHPISTEPLKDGKTVIQTVLIQLPSPADASVYHMAFGSILQCTKEQ